MRSEPFGTTHSGLESTEVGKKMISKDRERSWSVVLKHRHISCSEDLRCLMITIGSAYYEPLMYQRRVRVDLISQSMAFVPPNHPAKGSISNHIPWGLKDAFDRFSVPPMEQISYLIGIYGESGKH